MYYGKEEVSCGLSASLSLFTFWSFVLESFHPGFAAYFSTQLKADKASSKIIKKKEYCDGQIMPFRKSKWQQQQIGQNSLIYIVLTIFFWF